MWIYSKIQEYHFGVVYAERRKILHYILLQGANSKMIALYVEKKWIHAL